MLIAHKRTLDLINQNTNLFPCNVDFKDVIQQIFNEDAISKTYRAKIWYQ